MAVMREPDESPTILRALKPPRATLEAEPPVERLVQIAVDAAEQGDTSRATDLLGRVVGAFADSGLADYLDLRVETLTGSKWVRDVRVAALETLSASRGRKGDLNGALAALEEAFILAPTSELLSRIADLTARVRGVSEALGLVRAHLAATPDDPALSARAALLELDLGHRDLARELVDTALAQLPDHPVALMARARLDLTEGRAADARMTARRLVVDNPPLGRALLVLAQDKLAEVADDPALLTAVLADLPPDPWVLRQLAHLLLSLERHDDVLKVLDFDLLLNPGDVDALRMRGHTYANLGRWQLASADLEQAASRDTDGWLMSMRGLVARMLGDYETAVDLLREVPVDEAPSWLGAALADSMMRVNDEAGARAAYLEALERDSHDVEALCGLAMVVLRQEDADSNRQAEELVRTALEVDGAHGTAHALLGEVLRRKEHYREAIAEFDLALGSEREYTYAEASKGQALLALGEIDAGIKALFAAAERTPDQVWILDELVAALRQHQPQSAERVLRRLQRHLRQAGMDISPICSRRARLAHQQQRWEDADSLLDQARELEPDDRDLAATHVDVLRHLGRRTEALAIINELAPSMHDAALIRVKIDLLWSLGRLEEVRPELEAMRSEGSATAQAIAALGECYRLEGRRNEALELLRAANQREPNQPYVLASLGALELDQDQVEIARSHLMAALAIMPQYEFALDRLVALELGQGNGEAVRDVVDRLGGETNPELVQVRATALYDLGEYPRAAVALDQYLGDGGTDADLIRLRGWTTLALGQRREAARYFNLAAQSETATGHLLYTVTALMRVGSWQEAISVVERGQSQGDPLADAAMAELQLRVGAWGPAADWARRGLDLHPMSVPAAAAESRALRMLKEYDEALETARFWHDLRPADPWSVANLAECLLANRGDGDARPVFVEAVERFNRRAHLHSDDIQLKGWCLMRLGRFSEAAEIFLHSLTLTDQSTKALFHLLLASMLAGERLQSEVLANRTVEELKTLTTPSLRGALAVATYELEFIEPGLNSDLRTVARGLQQRIGEVLPKLDPDPRRLATISAIERDQLVEMG
jgi:tetratricopeptide (TPR) repeat protein